MVNSFVTGAQYFPRVGRASDGRFVVIWSSQGIDGSFQGIAARRFDASGNSLGAEFVVNTFTTGYQRFSDLAVDADGNFVAVWQDESTNRDGSGFGIFGQRYDASGNRIGSEFLVNSDTTGNQVFPSVSVAPGGGFVVVWSGPGDGDGSGVISRRFDASGNGVGNDFIVNTYTTGGQYGIVKMVAHDALGNFVVTWNGPGDGSASGSFAQRSALRAPVAVPSSRSTPTPRVRRDARRSPPMRWATS